VLDNNVTCEFLRTQIVSTLLPEEDPHKFKRRSLLPPSMQQKSIIKVGGKPPTASVKISSPCAATDEDIKLTIANKTVVLEQKTADDAAVDLETTEEIQDFENAVEANEAAMLSQDTALPEETTEEEATYESTKGGEDQDQEPVKKSIVVEDYFAPSNGGEKTN